MKRALERAAAIAFLIGLAPLLAAIALAVVVDSGRPVLFRQVRVGQGGRLFGLFKFRSMSNQGARSRIAVGVEPRVTRVGRFLRASKLDELPQLMNIWRGEMTFIGPRPEIPEFVDLESAAWRAVLLVRPGLLDPASLAYTGEAEYLARFPDPLRVYREEVLPHKLELSRRYLEARSIWSDAVLMGRAVSRMFRTRRPVGE